MLSHHEQHELEQIERRLEAEDPELTSRLRETGAGGLTEATRQPGLLRASAFALGVCLLLPGVISLNITLIGLGMLALVTAGMLPASRDQYDADARGDDETEVT